MELDVHPAGPAGQQSSQERDSPKLGKPSVIKSYCEKAIGEHGEGQHIWICIKRERRVIARDFVFPDDNTLGIQELRKYCGRLKRYFSLYSATAVQEVQVRWILFQQIIKLIGSKLRFLNVNKAGEIELVVKHMDRETVKAEYQENLERALEHPVNLYACGMNAMGDRHSDGTRENSFHYSDNLEDSCLIEYREHLRMNIAALTRLPYMLEFFWQNGIQRRGKEFLKGRGVFVQLSVSFKARPPLIFV
jgi:hypothetical protein